MNFVVRVKPADKVTILNNLGKAKALIDTPEKWTQDAFARDVHGNPTSWYAKALGREPVCFCAIGAVRKASNSIPPDEIISYAQDGITVLTEDFLGYVSKKLYGVSIESFNDRVKHFEVMGLFDEAIKEAKALETT